MARVERWIKGPGLFLIRRGRTARELPVETSGYTPVSPGPQANMTATATNNAWIGDTRSITLPVTLPATFVA